MVTVVTSDKAARNIKLLAIALPSLMLWFQAKHPNMIQKVVHVLQPLLSDGIHATHEFVTSKLMPAITNLIATRTMAMRSTMVQTTSITPIPTPNVLLVNAAADKLMYPYACDGNFWESNFLIPTADNIADSFTKPIFEPNQDSNFWGKDLSIQTKDVQDENMESTFDSINLDQLYQQFDVDLYRACGLEHLDSNVYRGVPIIRNSTFNWNEVWSKPIIRNRVPNNKEQ